MRTACNKPRENFNYIPSYFICAPRPLREPQWQTNILFWIKNIHLGFGKRVRTLRTRPSFIQFRWKIFQAYFSLLYRAEKMKQFLYFCLLFLAPSLPRTGYLLQSVVGERKRKVSFNCTAEVWTRPDLWELWCLGESRGC